MIWMHSLRMFADLSFFGMFAGTAASYLLQRIGGMDTQILPRSILGLGILSLIYGISFLYREKGKKRFFLLQFLALSLTGAAGGSVSGILESCIDFGRFSSAAGTVENFFTDYLAIGCLYSRRTDSASSFPSP